jgi:tetratricopeptide (TPR) repeat protein
MAPDFSTLLTPRFVRWLRLAAMASCAFGVSTFTPVFGHGALHERIAELTTAVQSKPADAPLRFELADVCFQHGDWQETLKQLDEIERIGPGQLPTTLLRGQALVAGGQMKAGRAQLDTFLTSHPDHPAALVARARALSELGEDGACLADYRHALEKAPHLEADLYLEIAEALAKRRLIDEAVSALQGGLSKLGNSPSLLLAAIQLEIATGRFDHALAHVEAMRQSAPRPEPWMAKRATILAQAGRSAEARTAWQNLLSHLTNLPPLDRGSPELSLLAQQAQRALGQATSPAPVVAPPANSVVTISQP